MSTVFGVALLVLLIGVVLIVVGSETAQGIAAGLGALLALPGFAMLLIGSAGSLANWRPDWLWEWGGLIGAGSVLIGGALLILAGWATSGAERK